MFKINLNRNPFLYEMLLLLEIIYEIVNKVNIMTNILKIGTESGNFDK